MKGTIDLNVDDTGNPLTCSSTTQPDPATGEMYSLHAFLAMYDPAGPLGKEKLRSWGGQEEARRASAAAQAGRIRIRVPPNTTHSWSRRRRHAGRRMARHRGSHAPGAAPMNVIVRNLTFLDTQDCFPEWSPADGPTGNWNAAYDSISIRNATHVWIDHNRFADARTRDDTQPVYFGHRYQVHDGLVDITNESDHRHGVVEPVRRHTTRPCSSVIPIARQRTANTCA